MCIIFKYLENKRLGAIINLNSENKLIQRVVIVFVDDTDFYANSESYESNIQEIMETYATLYEATSRKI